MDVNTAILDLSHQRKFLIAYSGGLDSHALLHFMTMLRAEYPDLQLRAIHVNHNLSINAKSWENHCQRICESLQIECLIKEIEIRSEHNLSLEAVARSLRYQALAESLHTDECLLTAHTKNDQAETILLQLLRGAGPKGLAAMPEKTAFANHWHLRPLLHVTRAEIRQYAYQHNLQWIEDESNFNRNFDRNFIRYEIMPILLQRWPGAITTLSRSAKHCADASKLLTSLAEQDLLQVQGSVPNTLSIAQLLSLSTEHQRNVLREWLLRLQLPLPNEIKIHQIQYEVLLAREDANPTITWQNVEIRRYQDNLYALSPPVVYPDLNWEAVWDTKTPLSLPANLGLLRAERIRGEGISLKKVKQIKVHFRHGGERCHPVGRIGSHPLKKLMQEWQVPTWERDAIPLLFSEDQLIAVVDHCICDGFQAQADEEGLVVRWDR